MRVFLDDLVSSQRFKILSWFTFSPFDTLHFSYKIWYILITGIIFPFHFMVLCLKFLHGFLFPAKPRYEYSSYTVYSHSKYFLPYQYYPLQVFFWQNLFTIKVFPPKEYFSLKSFSLMNNSVILSTEIVLFWLYTLQNIYLIITCFHHITFPSKIHFSL